MMLFASNVNTKSIILNGWRGISDQLKGPLSRNDAVKSSLTTDGHRWTRIKMVRGCIWDRTIRWLVN
ncbi:MAG TPA: hypothetical protein VF988_03545, partial [Verrucomicrobiae bacterium]